MFHPVQDELLIIYVDYGHEDDKHFSHVWLDCFGLLFSRNVFVCPQISIANGQNPLEDSFNVLISQTTTLTC